jgi:hypothetical protein
MASKNKLFGVTPFSPTEVTFDSDEGSFAGASNTKVKARFGIECNEPNGATFEETCSPVASMPVPAEK